MKKLPYKTKPQTQTVVIGNPKIGELELPKLFGLTPNEQVAIDALNLPNNMKELAALAKKIVLASNPKQKLNFVVVYNQLRKFVLKDFDEVDESKATFLETWFDEATEFGKRYVTNSNKLFYAKGMAVLNSRLNMDLTVEDMESPQAIHPGLALEVALFAQREENGMAEPEDENEKSEPVEDVEATEESLGEFLAA